jgi:hypothetical protein
MEKLLLEVIENKGNLEVKDFEQIKETLTTIVAKDYQVPSVIDNTNYVQSKETRAKLNKITKLISDRKTDMRKKALEMVKVAELQLKELAAIPEVASDKYDDLIKSYEAELEANRIKKANAIYTELSNLNTKNCSFETILEQVGSKWNNATTTEKQIKDDILGFYKKVDDDIEMIKSAFPEYHQFVIEYYLASFDMLEATKQGKQAWELANKHLETLEVEVEPTNQLLDEEKITLVFTIKASKSQIVKLNDCINKIGIEVIGAKKGE